MRLVIQRVVEASVTVNGKLISKIGRGLVILLGITTKDTPKMAEQFASKALRIRFWKEIAKEKKSKNAENVKENEKENENKKENENMKENENKKEIENKKENEKETQIAKQIVPEKIAEIVENQSNSEKITTSKIEKPDIENQEKVIENEQKEQPSKPNPWNEDEENIKRWHTSLIDNDYEVIVVSQFTL